jgi:lysozyme family protein
MQENFEPCFARLISPAIEGGYGDDKYDKGGPTNLGVTQKEYTAYRIAKKITPQSVKYITKDEAKLIYKIQYWNVMHCDELPAGVDWFAFDSAVNSGPVQAGKWLQRACNAWRGRFAAIETDGHVGLITVTMSRNVYGERGRELIEHMAKQRLTMVQSLKNWWRFGKGWTDRIALVKKQSLAMVEKHPEIQTVPFEFPSNTMPDKTIWARIGDWFVSWI